MEILNNFGSIYCFIAFVIGAVFMLVMLSVAAMGKVKEPRNKVRFFVAREQDNNYDNLWLFIGYPKKGEDSWEDIECKALRILPSQAFYRYGIDPDDFKDLKYEDEPVEVFINLED